MQKEINYVRKSSNIVLFFGLYMYDILKWKITFDARI